MAATHEPTLIAFFDCWKRSDLDGALALVSDGILFEPDLKGARHEGKAAVGALWASYMEAMRGYDYVLLAFAETGGTVFAERLETIQSSKGVELRLPIVGVFAIDDAGKIAAWRDYWDTSMAPGH